MKDYLSSRTDSYDDTYYSPDSFGSSTGAAVPLDDYGFSDYR